MVSVTCYLSSLDNAASMRAAAVSAFPRAAIDILQTQRQSLEPFAACEGVARLKYTENLQKEPFGFDYYVGRRIILTGTKLVFRDEDADIRLALQRLEKAIAPLGATSNDVFWMGVYPLTRPVAAKIGNLRKEFVKSPHELDEPSQVLFEGLPSTDATAAIEIMAAVP